MAVYYKFKSAKDYDSIPIDGQFISVASLKERIFESKYFGRGKDFDLVITNTLEEEYDEGAMIPKNTSVLIRRVPGRPRNPIVTQQEETKSVDDKADHIKPTTSNMLVGDSSMKYPDEIEWDEFGNDPYSSDAIISQPSNPIVDIPSSSKIDEDSKIRALVDTPALDYSAVQDGYGAGRGFGRGKLIAGRGFGRGFERKMPPPGYVCHRCKIPGHFIQHCPTNGDPNYDVRRVKPPTGIPKSMLMVTPDGSYALPSGGVAVLKPNEAAFEKEIEGLPTAHPNIDVPPELLCPFCKEVMKDAVLTSKCCFRSFCDKCIRDYIISKSSCVCGATNILADDLLPNRTLRETISRILENTTSSTDNVGSTFPAQDMESAIPARSKNKSPSESAASKQEPRGTGALEHSPEAERSSGIKVQDTQLSSSEKKADVVPEVAEGTAELAYVKEMKPTGSAPIQAADLRDKPSVVEAKKKKKKKVVRPQANADDMQWRNYQEAENLAAMQMAAAAYNPYWNGVMPLGMEGFMAPIPGPYMSYGAGPFDHPFGGGVMQQDPFMAQSYMMPPMPRDLSQLAPNSAGVNMGRPMGGRPAMSREELDARRPNLRRQREMDRFSEREDRDKVREREREREKEKHHETVREREKHNETVRERDRHHHSRDCSGDRGSTRTKVRESESMDAEEGSRAEKQQQQWRAGREEENEHKGRRARAAESSRGHGGEGRSPLAAAPDSGSSPRRSSGSAAAKGKGRPSDADEEAEARADERKAKASVFSRISFPSPDADPGSNKRRRGRADEEAGDRKRKATGDGNEEEGEDAEERHHRRGGGRRQRTADPDGEQQRRHGPRDREAQKRERKG